MDNKQLEDFIKSIDQDLEIKVGKQFTEVSVPLSKLYPLAMRLRENKEAQFDFLFNLSGVDYGHDLGVVYHLRSTVYSHSIVLKTRTSDRENPQIDSVSGIWETANLHEREVYDLLGIKFTNHPDLQKTFSRQFMGFSAEERLCR